MLCSHCGGQIPEGCKFCPDCGSPITAGPTPEDGGYNPRNDSSEEEKRYVLCDIIKRAYGSATLWSVSGWLLIICSALVLVATIYLFNTRLIAMDMSTYVSTVITSLIAVAVGIFNLCIGGRNFGFVKRTERNPVDIYEFFEKSGTIFPIIVSFIGLFLAMDILCILGIVAAFKDNSLKRDIETVDYRRIISDIEHNRTA